jgi:hypothetical protein
MTKARPLPPLELVRELFDYDKESGIVTWKTPRTNRVKKGNAVGVRCKSNCKDYLKVGISYNGGHAGYKLHRVIWLFVTGEDPGLLQIDHIDGNGLNNSFANLRIANGSENLCNCERRKDNRSGFKGVGWSKQKKKWRARIAFNGRQRELGFFDTPELAHMAYAAAAAELHGDFARAA